MNQYSAQDFETLNSTVKLNRSLKQFHGTTKPLTWFFEFFISFILKQDLILLIVTKQKQVMVLQEKIFDKV